MASGAQRITRDARRATGRRLDLSDDVLVRGAFGFSGGGEGTLGLAKNYGDSWRMVGNALVGAWAPKMTPAGNCVVTSLDALASCAGAASDGTSPGAP